MISRVCIAEITYKPATFSLSPSTIPERTTPEPISLLAAFLDFTLTPNSTYFLPLPLAAAIFKPV